MLDPNRRGAGAMSRSRAGATLGTVVFLVLVPGTVAGLTPWWLTHWEAGGPLPLWPLWEVVGVVLVAAGTGVLLEAFARFVVDGIGTPAPVAPTEKLVVSGLYRHVRNPMYLAVGAAIAGQALLLGRAVLVGYLAAYAVAVASFVRGYEEPTLRRRFGGDYDTYCQAVPAWRPRLTAWSPGTTSRH